MVDRKLPRPRAELAQFQPYRTQMLKADVRINANEWPEPNVAGRYITAEELNGVLLNRYPGRGDELREILSARWGTKPDRLILGNGSNELLLQVFLVFGGHGRKTLLFHPTYSMHGRLTQLAGGTVIEEIAGQHADAHGRGAHRARRGIHRASARARQERARPSPQGDPRRAGDRGVPLGDELHPLPPPERETGRRSCAVPRAERPHSRHLYLARV